jgi:hypothetical protein
MNRSGNFKAIKVKNPFIKHVDQYRDDCNRIQACLLDHGLFATLDQCAELWELASEDMCAGWLVLPEKGEDIYTEVKRYIEIQD